MPRINPRVIPLVYRARILSPKRITLIPEMVPGTPQFEAAIGIVEKLRAAGHQAYLAGGCVRDLLLGRSPVNYDVATSATPDIVLDMFPRTFAVGAHFGVVLVAAENAEAAFVTEVATFRSTVNVQGRFIRQGACHEDAELSKGWSPGRIRPDLFILNRTRRSGTEIRCRRDFFLPLSSFFTPRPPRARRRPALRSRSTMGLGSRSRATCGRSPVRTRTMGRSRRRSGWTAWSCF